MQTALYTEIITSEHYPTESAVIKKASQIGIILQPFEGWQATEPDGYNNQRTFYKSERIVNNRKLLDLIMDSCEIITDNEFDMPQINHVKIPKRKIIYVSSNLYDL